MHKGVNLKGQYHESVANIKYTVVSLTTVRREQFFVISERNPTSSLVTSQISQEWRGITMTRNLPTTFVIRLL